MASRAEQKARTRSALIDSWLGLIGEGTNFAAVSLREVARAAGVVPTSFYRHFGDLDELGLAVIDAVGTQARGLLPSPAEAPPATEAAVMQAVDRYVRFVRSGADRIRFVDQARTGGSPMLREAIGREVSGLTTAVGDLVHAAVPGAPDIDATEAAAAIVAILLESAGPAMDLGSRDTRARKELVASLTRRIMLVLGGVQATAPTTRRKRKPATARATGARPARKGSAA